MSWSDPFDMECPACGEETPTTVWRSIDSQTEPEAKRDLIEGRVNVFTCSFCGLSHQVGAGLTYDDAENDFCARFVPFSKTHVPSYLDLLTEDGQVGLPATVPQDMIPARFNNVHQVFSMAELAKYVDFRDRLASHRKSRTSSALPCCFSCGGTIQHGELACSVSRLHQLKGEADQEDDEILHAVASLQVCSECMFRAATGDIDFPEHPLPLLELEKKGLNQFARQVADNVAELKPVAVGRDKCSLCGAAIEVGDTYRRLEVAAESSDAEGIQEIVSQTLGILCEKCSEDYLILV